MRLVLSAAALSFVILSLLHFGTAAFCNGAPDPAAKANANPIWSENPRFVRSVANASLFRAGNGEDEVSIVHLWGTTAHERGRAHGELMKDEAVRFYGRAFQFFEEQFVGAVNKSVPWIP